MRPIAQIGDRIQQLIAKPEGAGSAVELLSLGEQVLEHWVSAKGKQPSADQREGFRLLALHRQGAGGDPSFNACRETCRELVYHYNLVTLEPEHLECEKRLKMMGLVANHLYLFISGKMETQQLGDFCCASKPLRSGLN